MSNPNDESFFLGNGDSQRSLKKFKKKFKMLKMSPTEVVQIFHLNNM